VPARMRRCGCRGILLAGASLIDELQMAPEGCTIERTGDPSVSPSRNGCVAGRGCGTRNKKRVNDAAARNYLSAFPSNARTKGSLSTPNA